MAEYLVIRLPRDPGQPASWIAVDETGARRSAPASGDLLEATAEVGDRKVVALVPSADVLTTTVDIPVKGAKLQAALPYALEEYLAEDVDNLHFAPGTRRSSGRKPVSVVARAKLQAWLDMLAEAGIVPPSGIAESYGLARIPGTISLLLAEDSVFINDGADVELVMQGVSPGDALVAIGALDDDVSHADDQADSSRVRPRHILVYCTAADDERYRHDWLAIRQELDSLDVKLLPDGVMPRLAVTVATGAGVNLLQGAFAPKREYSGLLRPWRHVAMLLVGLGLVGLAVKVTDYYVLSAQETELRETFNSEYQAMVPGAPTTDDPMAVVDSLRRRLGTVETSPVFLQSMEQLSNAISQNRQARIQAISFRGGVIDLRISAPDVATLDAVQRSIADSGQFSAAIQSTDQDGDRVASRIQIEEAG